MADEKTSPGGVTQAPELDPHQVQFALERIRSQQNLAGALGAGLVASLVGAAAWAAITVATGYQIGWMAIGVGFAVGFAVRAVGKGIDQSFGIVGGALSLVGCALGNLFTGCALIAENEGIALHEVLARLDLATAQNVMVATFSPMDLLFYGIAVYEGYKLSFRQLTLQDLQPGVPH